MKRKLLLYKDLRIFIISRFYLYSAILLSLSLCLFSTYIEFFGQRIYSQLTFGVYFGFIIFLYFLYDAIKHVKIAGFLPALFIQIVFLVNSFQMLLEKSPILNIKSQGNISVGLMEKDSVIIAGIIINILLIINIFYCLRMSGRKMYRKNRASKSAK